MALAIRRKSAWSLSLVGEALGIPNLDRESGKIFVTGGTGVLGHRVAARLLHAGYPNVRLGTINIDSLEDLNKLGAEIAEFSWFNEETYENALKGIKSVLITIPYDYHWYKRFPAFLKACRKARVKRLVKLSFYHAGVPGDIFRQIPLVSHHADCDELLVKMVRPDEETFSNMTYTILYASHFMSHPFTFYGTELRNSETTGTLYGASMNRGVNYVSPNDVAEVIVRVLLAPHEHINQEYTLTGPGPITDLEIADLLSKYLKKAVVYVDQTIEQFRDTIQLRGDPYWMVADLVAMEKIKASGTEEDNAFVSKDFEQICGHPPESFEDYLMRTDMMTAVEAGAPSELKPLKGTIAE